MGMQGQLEGVSRYDRCRRGGMESETCSALDRARGDREPEQRPARAFLLPLTDLNTAALPALFPWPEAARNPAEREE